MYAIAAGRRGNPPPQLPHGKELTPHSPRSEDTVLDDEVLPTGPKEPPVR